MKPRSFQTDQQPQQQDPEHGKSPTELGIFTVFVEILGAALLLAIGIHFVTTASEPDAVAWTAFALIVILLFDGARRLIKISTGKVRR